MPARFHFVLLILSSTSVFCKSFERRSRTGGFPKFPIPRAGIQCGSRVVSHTPQRVGSNIASAKIVGGSSAPYGAYPWQVEIQAYKPLNHKYEHHCAGAVIGEKVIVTAAHCITNLEHPEKMRLLVGKMDLSAREYHERAYKPEKIIIHPDFRKMGPHSNDIAIIKLKTSDGGIQFNSHVQPICLPDTLNRRADVGDWCTVTGWGAQKSEDFESLSDTLQVAAVPLWDLQTCRRSDVYGGRDQSILDSMICAGVKEGGVDACGGDSGGPLACQVNGYFVLTGLVSWGDGCAKKNRPGVYTRVSHYIPWILQSFKKLGV